MFSPHSMSQRWVLVSLACIAAVACTSFLVQRSSSSIILKDVTVAYIKQQASLMKQKNEELEKEDQVLAEEERAEERYVESERKAKKLAEQAKKTRLIQIENAKLLLENQKLRNKVLREEMEARKARILAMKESMRAGDYSSAVKGIRADRSKLVSPAPAAAAPHDHASRLSKKSLHAKKVKLAGKYVKSCVGKDCRVRYIPQDVKDWEAANHTMVVMGNGIGIPLGPTIRTKLDPSLAPLRDLPKSASSGHKLADSISREMTREFTDNFVRWQDTVLNPSNAPAPWNAEQKTVDMEGLETVQGRNGTLPAYEATPLSSGMHQDNDSPLAERGVNVNSVSYLSEGDTRHQWGRDGEDHAPKAEAKRWDYGAMSDSPWAYENHAMKSQGWDPDGKKNKQLMLGRFWNESKDSQLLGDDFVPREEYAKQIEAQHGELRTPDHDHFADWEANSTKNLKLLFGDSGSLAYHHDKNKHTYQKNAWGLGDLPTEPQALVDKGLTFRSDIPRTGEPITDAVTPSRGWSGENMIDAQSNIIHGQNFPTEPTKPTPPGKLAKLGVKV